MLWPDLVTRLDTSVVVDVLKEAGVPREESGESILLGVLC